MFSTVTKKGCCCGLDFLVHARRNLPEPLRARRAPARPTTGSARGAEGAIATEAPAWQPGRSEAASSEGAPEGFVGRATGDRLSSRPRARLPVAPSGGKGRLNLSKISTSRWLVLPTCWYSVLGTHRSFLRSSSFRHFLDGDLGANAMEPSVYFSDVLFYELQCTSVVMQLFWDRFPDHNIYFVYCM